MKSRSTSVDYDVFHPKSCQGESLMPETSLLLAELDAFFKTERQNMLSLLRETVNRESGSNDIEDVTLFGDFLADICRNMGGKITRQTATAAGDPIACAFTDGSDSASRPILLVCHRDTVFPHGTVAQRPYSEDEVCAYGPGVADMKGGIVAGIFAIKAILALRDIVGSIPVEIVFSSDEEIGSAVSGPFIAERCKTAKAAFFLEPARENGCLVIGRDGGDLLNLEVFGRSSHAGNAFAEGISAITGLAGLIRDFSRLSNDAEGYSVNVGLIGGGTGAIIVADHAWARIYTRFSTMEQRDYLLERFRAIIADHRQTGMRFVLSEPTGFLPFLPNEKNTRLYTLVRESGKQLGLEITGMRVRGAADAGIASCAGIPTICGMGPVGGNLHTDREFMNKASLAERAKLLTLAIVHANNRL